MSVIISTAYLFLVTKGLEPILADFGHKVGYSLDRLPIHCSADAKTKNHSCSHSHILYEQFRVGTLVSLDCKRKLENPKETCTCPGRTCKLRTEKHPGLIWGTNQGPSYYGTAVLTTVGQL